MATIKLAHGEQRFAISIYCHEYHRKSKILVTRTELWEQYAVISGTSERREENGSPNHGKYRIASRRGKHLEVTRCNNTNCTVLFALLLIYAYSTAHAFGDALNDDIISDILKVIIGREGDAGEIMSSKSDRPTYGFLYLGRTLSINHAIHHRI